MEFVAGIVSAFVGTLLIAAVVFWPSLLVAPLVFGAWAVMMLSGRSTWDRALSRSLVRWTASAGALIAILLNLATIRDSLTTLPALVFPLWLVMVPWLSSLLFAAITSFFATRSLATSRSESTPLLAADAQPNDADPSSALVVPVREPDGTWHLGLPPT